MKSIVFLALIVVAIISIASSIEFVDGSTKSVYFTSEEGSIKVDQEKYLKPKYVHEPI